MASGAKCNFNDQCKSYNCHNKQCKCNEDKQVFIEKQNTCLSGNYSISKQFIAKYWHFLWSKLRIGIILVYMTNNVLIWNLTIQQNVLIMFVPVIKDTHQL